MIISIEGVDGVGKTSISKKLAEILKYKYIDKPLKHYLNDDIYFLVKNTIKSFNDRYLIALFYILNFSVGLKEGNEKNVILDRGVLSNLVWIADDNIIKIVKTFLDNFIKPDLTFILTLNENELEKRLKTRSINDKDLFKCKYFSKMQIKLISIANLLELNYFIINRNKLNIEQTVNIILNKLKDINIKSS